MASQDWFEKDFYSILGVSKDADATAIKKAYRRLARKHHPDKNPGDAAAEQKFKEIGEAHAVLSDPEQREEYDAMRQMAQGGARFTAGGPGGAAGGGGFEDIFSAFGGGGGGSRVRFDTGGGPSYGGYGGGTEDINDILSQMFGGAAPGGGRGRQSPYAGYGAPRGPRKGSDVEPHPVFGRDGKNLTIDLPVSFTEAALGATVPVPTLDGSSVKVRLAPGTPSGRVLRVKGRGVTTKSGTGDLLAKVHVVVPKVLSDKAREALEVLRDESVDEDPRADLVRKARA